MDKDNLIRKVGTVKLEVIESRRVVLNKYNFNKIRTKSLSKRYIVGKRTSIYFGKVYVVVKGKSRTFTLEVNKFRLYIPYNFLLF